MGVTEAPRSFLKERREVVVQSDLPIRGLNSEDAARLGIIENERPIELVEGLLEEGFSPIVWCRYIATSLSLIHISEPTRPY